MTGASLLNTLCGTSTIDAVLQCSYQDNTYRKLVLEWLKQIIYDIDTRQIQWHWRFLEKTSTASTVADQHTYDLPSDINTNKVFAIYDRTNDRTYKYVPYDRFVRTVADPSNYTGDAIWWTFWANTRRILPVPDSVWTMYLDYIKTNTQPADDATDLDIPDVYTDVIIAGAKAKAYQIEPDLGDFAAAQQLYEAGINRMIANNKSMIGELPQSESHRDRKSKLDTWYSYYFPLADITT